MVTVSLDKLRQMVFIDAGLTQHRDWQKPEG